MAKLAATEATQRAVARATQVVGADSFRAGHIVERLAQDVRALELFAGRTEALREAVALETLAENAVTQALKTQNSNTAASSGLTASPLVLNT